MIVETTYGKEEFKMSLIKIKNLTKRYGNRLAVDNMSLEIEEGKMFGLLGPNGAGKSTCISMICGLIKPEVGDIEINGYSILKQKVKAQENIGFVPQNVALYKNLSARDNLEFFGGIYGLSGKLLKERVDEALEIAGLKEREKEKIDTFSGGMKRRINIACAIMHHPKIIIMDEPTVGIDPQSRNHILQSAKYLNEEYNSAIIYTSHYMEEVEFLCTHIAIMDEGKIITKGTIDEVKRLASGVENLELKVSNVTPTVIATLQAMEGIRGVDFRENTLRVTVKDPQSKLQQIIDVLGKASAKLYNININEPNLESVFLNLTGKKLRD